MENTADTDCSKLVLEKLRSLTRHAHIRLTDRGNSAIHFALEIAKAEGRKTLLIPDQGGWLTYQQFGTELGFKVIEVVTDDALIDLKDLELKLRQNKHTAFIFASLGAYIVPQDIKAITDMAKKHDCLTIEDCTGSIGMKRSGEGMDIRICSMGKWKILNLHYGGFISTDNEKIAGHFPDLKDHAFNPAYLEKLCTVIDEVPARREFLHNKVEEVKKDLKRYDIVHPEAKGINVIVRYKDDKEKADIEQYCRNNSLECTYCPKPFKLDTEAISIEVKRLE